MITLISTGECRRILLLGKVEWRKWWCHFDVCQFDIFMGSESGNSCRSLAIWNSGVLVWNITRNSSVLRWSRSPGNGWDNQWTSVEYRVWRPFCRSGILVASDETQPELASGKKRLIGSYNWKWRLTPNDQQGPQIPTLPWEGGVCVSLALSPLLLPYVLWPRSLLQMGFSMWQEVEPWTASQLPSPAYGVWWHLAPSFMF